VSLAIPARHAAKIEPLEVVFTGQISDIDISSSEITPGNDS
jgi:hypothetical protein